MSSSRAENGLESRHMLGSLRAHGALYGRRGVSLRLDCTRWRFSAAQRPWRPRINPAERVKSRGPISRSCLGRSAQPLTAADASQLSHDAPVSPSIISPAFAPFNQLSFALSVLKSKVVFNQLGEKTFDVGHNGTLHPVKFQRLSGTQRGLPIAGFTTGRGVVQSQGPANIAKAGGRCFAVGHSGMTVDVGLESPVSTPGAAWLLVGMASSSNGVVDVSTLSNGVQASAGSIDVTAGARPDDYLLPLSQRRLDGLQIIDGTAGQSICISSVDVGTFSSSSG